MISQFNPRWSVAKKHDKFKLNFKKLLITGSPTSKIYAHTIMASSFTLVQCKHMTEDTMCEKIVSNDGDNKLKYGRHCFHKYKQLFEELITLKDIPSNAYKYWVPINKISLAISFFQQTLQMKPGITQNLSLDGCSFNHLPVYQCGGIPINFCLNFTY